MSTEGLEADTRHDSPALHGSPVIANTCCSFVNPRDLVHVASVHKWNAEQQTPTGVQAAGGLSSVRNGLQASQALNWARINWADALT